MNRRKITETDKLAYDGLGLKLDQRIALFDDIGCNIIKMNSEKAGKKVIYWPSRVSRIQALDTAAKKIWASSSKIQGWLADARRPLLGHMVENGFVLSGISAKTDAGNAGHQEFFTQLQGIELGQSYEIAPLISRLWPSSESEMRELMAMATLYNATNGFDALKSVKALSPGNLSGTSGQATHETINPAQTSSSDDLLALSHQAAAEVIIRASQSEGFLQKIREDNGLKTAIRELYRYIS